MITCFIIIPMHEVVTWENCSVRGDDSMCKDVAIETQLMWL